MPWDLKLCFGLSNTFNWFFMKQFEITAHKRDSFTKAAVKQLRREGRVPGILYGKQMDTIHFSVMEIDMRNLLYTPNSYSVYLNIEGKINMPLQDSQFHPLTDRILHLDFSLDPKNRYLHVPVVLKGNSRGTKEANEVLNRFWFLQPKDFDTLTLMLHPLEKLHGRRLSLITFRFTPKSAIVCMVKMTGPLFLMQQKQKKMKLWPKKEQKNRGSTDMREKPRKHKPSYLTHVLSDYRT